MIFKNNLNTLNKKIINNDILTKYNITNSFFIPNLVNIKIIIFFNNFELNLLKKILSSLFFFKNLTNKQGVIYNINFGYKNKKKNITCTMALTLRKKIMKNFYGYIYLILLPNIEKKRLNFKRFKSNHKLFIKIENLKSFYNLNENLLKTNFLVKLELEYSNYFKKILNNINNYFINI